MRTVALAFALFLLAGCAHVVPQELRAEAVQVDVEHLFGQPELYRGKTVILGGVVVEATNTEEGTILEMLEKPLDSRGRPRDTDLSRGRFIVKHDERLDTFIFQPGRELTAVGEVLGVERRPLGEMEYPYPALRSRAIYIHKETARQRHIPVHFGIGVFKTY
ncbi:MAG: Slp family lipoprotein [Nitrospirota bacterium]|jgi:outer membrane lipoprotein